MSYIPKSAQRKIDKYNAKSRVIRLSPEVEAKLVQTFENRTPQVLRQGDPGCQRWAVYFNGERQHLCSYASVPEGKIVRYVSGMGNEANTRQTEVLFGTVEIRSKF